MQIEEMKSLVQAATEASHLEVELDGNHVKLVVVSVKFEGLTPVKKQQLVYACLQEAIGSGVLHAVHMKTYTPAQWAELNA